MVSRHSRTSTLVALLVAAAPAFAQVSQTTGAIRGIVSSKKGDFVEGATVTLRNLENGTSRVVKTDVLGYFAFPYIAVGPYEVTVSAATYRSAKSSRLNINIGATATTNFELDAATVEATVEVVAVAAKVDAERTSSATLMSPDALTNLPIKGRGFIDFATLTPQVQVDPNRGNLAIAGQRGVNTSINIDGGDYNQAFFGGMTGSAEGKTPFTVSIEAIREFQVVTDGAPADVGRMGGGYVNAVTKSGTNELTGSLFYFTRPRNLVAKDHQTGKEVADFQTKQYGFSVGGPIVKDKLFYFVAYDGQKETRPAGFLLGGTIPPAGLFPLDPAKASDAALIARNFDYSTRADSYTAFLRLDWFVNPDHNLQLRVNKSNFDGNVGQGSFNALDSVSTDVIKTSSVVGQWNWTIGSSWINQLSFNLTKDEQPRVANSKSPQVSVSNVITYGSGINFEREFETKRTQITETLTYVNPKVEVKGGFDINTTKVAEVFASTQYGSYSFNNITDYRAGNWTTFQQRFSLVPGQTARDSGTFEATEHELALFLQTDWHLASNLKVGLGLRWDRQQHPDFLVADFSNPLATSMPVSASIPNDSQFSPRLSFTWTPEGDKGRTLVRGNVGRYVSRTPSVFLFQAYAENGQRAARISFSPSQAAAFGIPIGASFNWNSPYRLAALPTGVALPALDVFTFGRDFKNPYTDRLHLGVERVHGEWVLGISADYAKGEQLERLQDINLPAPTLNAQGREVFGTRPNTKFRQLMQYVSDGSSTYNALTLSAKYQKDSSPFAAQFFYTFSQNRDNDSNERNFSAYSTQNSQRLSDEWSWADSDRRNTLTGFLSYHEKRFSGILFGFNFRYLSGLPYSAIRSADLNGDGITSNDRLLGSQRNGYRRAATTFVDLKMGRDWRFGRVGFSVSAELFNLFNHVERYGRITFAGTDAAPVITYPQTAVSNPRQVQLGARLSF